MKTGLVLGAGGVVGLSYHAGVLRALEQVGGVVPDDADLIVGTSAGSVVGAYIRSGWSTQDFWDLAMGTHPTSAAIGVGPGNELLSSQIRNPVDLVRRGVGTSFVLLRTLARMPAPNVPGFLRHAFPGGLFAMKEGQRRFAEELPAEWPEKPLWLCAFDLDRGGRVVLGRSRKGLPANLRQAVMASCAIPGLYDPVRINGRTFIDGGAHSTSNLDLAARATCDLIIGVVPMAFDTADVPSPVFQLMRRLPSWTLARETARARNRGSEVLLIRPTAAEIALHGFNMMRPDGVDAVAMAAYDATARLLETDRFKKILGERRPAA